jgi:hypothetical protein
VTKLLAQVVRQGSPVHPPHLRYLQPVQAVHLVLATRQLVQHVLRDMHVHQTPKTVSQHVPKGIIRLVRQLFVPSVQQAHTVCLQLLPLLLVQLVLTVKTEQWRVQCVQQATHVSFLIISPLSVQLDIIAPVDLPCAVCVAPGTCAVTDSTQIHLLLVQSVLLEGTVILQILVFCVLQELMG